MAQNIETTLEVTDAHIKILKVKKSGNQKIITFSWIQNIVSFSDDRISALLSEKFSSQPRLLDHLAIIVPRRYVILKKLKLPSQNLDELKRMINVQLVNLIPYPAEDVTFDFKIIHKDQAGFSQVLIVLVNKDVTALYKQHLKEGGAILFHIPSRFFNLKPILAHISKDLGGYAAFKSTPDEGLTMRTVWGIITWNQQKYLQLVSQGGWQMLEASNYPSIRGWDDDYSTVLPIIQWQQVQGPFHR